MYKIVKHIFHTTAVFSMLTLIPLHRSAADSTTYPAKEPFGQSRQHPQSNENTGDSIRGEPRVRQSEQFVINGLPSTLPFPDAVKLPVLMTTLITKDGVIVIPAAYLPVTVHEPQHNRAFDKVDYVYLFDRSNRKLLHLFCRVMYNETPDSNFAKRICSLIAISNSLYESKLGYSVTDNVPFNVWLTRDGDTGGEQWKNNLYLYNITVERSSIEWIREITHEFSHLAFPPIGGYSEPEYWANGYIGERLIVRWIAESPISTAMVEKSWGTFSGYANFKTKLLDPPLALYRAHPKSKNYLLLNNEIGMRYLIGQILTIDDKYGGKVLGKVFRNLPKYRQANSTDIGDVLGYLLHRAAANKIGKHAVGT